MNSRFSRWTLALVLAWVPAAIAQEKPKAAEAETKAKALMAALVDKDFKAAGKDFDATMKKAFTEEGMAKFWAKLVATVGPFKKQLGTRTEMDGKVVLVTCEFAKFKLDARVAFDKEGKISGLRFLPSTAAFDYKPPPYARPALYSEQELVVGEGGDWPLKGTLTVPKRKGRYPAVVLVHGSGAHDRDETIMPNKPFRDLAWGLASQGVVVLRYEKRNKTYPEKMKKMMDDKKLTIKEEVTDDALAAVELLRKQKKVDPRRVFVLGHSLGAFVAPRIGEGDPKLAGLILMAGNSRPLIDLVLDQFNYIYSLKGKLSDEDKAELEKIKKSVARVKDPKLTPDAPAEALALNIPACYWLALRAYDPVKTAAGLKMPMLILQGERDYQVTMDDLAGWKKGLAKRKNVTIKSFPALNHLFAEGKGKGKPDEYMKAGHVAPEVIEAIAAWVKR
jgi:dienelactone hydrolase